MRTPPRAYTSPPLAPVQQDQSYTFRGPKCPIRLGRNWLPCCLLPGRVERASKAHPLSLLGAHAGQRK